MVPPRPRSLRWLALGALAWLAGTGAGGAARAEGPAALLAFIGPLSGPHAAAARESLDAVQHAVAWRNAQGGGGRRRLEVRSFDDGEDPARAEKAFEEAARARADAVVAAPGARTADALVARARKGKPWLPVIVVGGAAPKPTADLRDPVLFLGAYPVDQAVHAVNALALPMRASRPGLLIENLPAWAALGLAIERNLGAGRERGPAVLVPAGRGPDAAGHLDLLRDARCDAVVVVGEPAFLDLTLEALERAKWPVPVLAVGDLLTAAARKPYALPPERVCFLVGGGQRAMEGAPRPLVDAMEAAGAGPAAVLPRAVRAWTATMLLADALAPPAGGKPRKAQEVLDAVRAVRYGREESEVPLFDASGFASLPRWTVWRCGPKGPEPFEAGRLPADTFGPLFGLRKPSLYRVEPGTKACLVTFGTNTSKPARTIEGDLAALGLATKGYEETLDFRVREELMARVLGKLSRLFLKNEDGTGIPGVSFGLSFVADLPKDMKASEAWLVHIAGDDPAAGGRAFGGRAEVYSTFLRRTIFETAAVAPPIDRADLPAISGTQPWKGIPLEHMRADQVRGLLDGYAGAIALTGAHEVGHLLGLGHDEADPRSIMNVAEGVGLRETQAFFIPEHALVIERLVGRWKAPGSARR